MFKVIYLWGSLSTKVADYVDNRQQGSSLGFETDSKPLNHWCLSCYIREKKREEQWVKFSRVRWLRLVEQKHLMTFSNLAFSRSSWAPSSICWSLQEWRGEVRVRGTTVPKMEQEYLLNTWIHVRNRNTSKFINFEGFSFVFLNKRIWCKKTPQYRVHQGSILI